MNFPDFLRSVWSDPRFQELSDPTKLLFYSALSQVDIAGWWAPNKRLLAVDFPGIDLAQAAKDLRPWVRVHPTGFWSLRGYVAMQAGGTGVLDTNKGGFHKGLLRVLKVHALREIEAGGSLSDIEGLGSDSVAPGAPATGQGETPAKKGHAVTLNRATADSESPKSDAPSPHVVKSVVPTGVQGDAQAHPDDTGGSDAPADPGPCLFDAVVAGVARLYPDQADDVAPWLRDKVHKAAARHGWALLQRAAERWATSGPRTSQKKGLAAFLDDLPAVARLACQHDQPGRRTWWWAPQDPARPLGIIVRHARCKDCGHHEEQPETAMLPADHVHAYEVQQHAGWVLGDAGAVVAVKPGTWESCGRCGHAQAVGVLP